MATAVQRTSIAVSLAEHHAPVKPVLAVTGVFPEAIQTLAARALVPAVVQRLLAGLQARLAVQTQPLASPMVLPAT